MTAAKHHGLWHAAEFCTVDAVATATQISGLPAPCTSGLLKMAAGPGTFIYSSALGTVLGSGMQTLSVTFTLTNIGTKYTNFTILSRLTCADELGQST
ncbi:MAG: hypothetical protein WDN23_01225 [Edaphobacter sp.]